MLPTGPTRLQAVNWVLDQIERGSIHMYRRSGLGAILAVSLASSGCGSWFYTGQHPSVAYGSTADHMPENIRRSIRTVEVVADNKKPELRVGGDYGQYRSTIGEGAAGGDNPAILRRSLASTRLGRRCYYAARVAAFHVEGLQPIW